MKGFFSKFHFSYNNSVLSRNKDILTNFTRISNWERLQLIVKNSYNAMAEPSKSNF